jgi:hypothetical protein
MRRILLTCALVVALWVPVPSAVFSLPATDNFTRADSGSLGANWTEQIHGLQIISNQAPGDTDLNYQAAFWNADVFGNDQYSELTFTNYSDSANQVGPLVRASGTGGSSVGYLMFCMGAGPNITRLYTYSGGSLFTTQIGTDISTPWVDGDVARLEVSGTTFTLKRNGSTVGTETDATVASGSAGFMLRNEGGPGASLWTGGNVGGGGGGGGSHACRLASLGAGCDAEAAAAGLHHLQARPH